MVSIFSRGRALQGQTPTEVLNFLAAVAGGVPAIGVVYESGGRVVAALLAMKVGSRAELLDEIGERAVGIDTGEGTLMNLGLELPVTELLSEKWPEDLDPVRNEASEKLLRFRIRRHQSAPAKTPG